MASSTILLLGVLASVAAASQPGVGALLPDFLVNTLGGCARVVGAGGVFRGKLIDRGTVLLANCSMRVAATG